LYPDSEVIFYCPSRFTGRFGQQPQDLCRRDSVSAYPLPVGLEERHPYDGGSFKYRTDGAPGVTFFDTLEERARNPDTCCHFLSRYLAFNSRDADHLSQQRQGLHTVARIGAIRWL
jgi:hypothetical protein